MPLDSGLESRIESIATMRQLRVQSLEELIHRLRLLFDSTSGLINPYAMRALGSSDHSRSIQGTRSNLLLRNSQVVSRTLPYHSLQPEHSSQQVDIEAVKQLMQSYESKPDEWLKYVHHDPQRYTRSLVDSGNGKYNLLLLTWPTQTASCIHAHEDAHCVMKILSGSIHEVKYSWPTTRGQGMKMVAETRLDQKNDVAYINGKGLV